MFTCVREFKVMDDALGRDYGITYCDLVCDKFLFR